MPSRLRALAVCILVGGWSAGCGPRRTPSTTPPPPSVAADAVPPPTLGPPEAPPELPSSVESEDEAFARLTVDQLNAQQPLKDVYFDLDSDRLDGSQLDVLQTNARWLARWPSTRITIEGHCDARGTSEYNLALGERRAAAVRTYLTSLGIAGQRIVTVSKGEEEPVCGESSEDCWQRNRRGRPVIIAK